MQYKTESLEKSILEVQLDETKHVKPDQLI